MNVVDVNILLYANNPDSLDYSLCREWVEEALYGSEVVALPWQTLLAFIRIITTPSFGRHSLPSTEACRIVASWLARPNVLIIEPGIQFWPIFTDQVLKARIAGPLVTDAALASIALERGARVCTRDRDFLRFTGLEIFDPGARS